MKVVASALDMNVADYTEKTKKQEHVNLRNICARLLLKYGICERMTQVAHLYKMNKATVKHGLDRIAIDIKTCDDIKTQYEAAEAAVIEWLTKYIDDGK